MANLIKQTKEKIERIEQELKDIAVKLDEERNESISDDTNIKTELLDKKAYLEEQLESLKSSLNSMENSLKAKDAFNLGVEAVVAINGTERNMTIVDSAQADPASGLISADSPIGQALLGKKAGENVDVTTPAGIRKFSILKIMNI